MTKSKQNREKTSRECKILGRFEMWIIFSIMVIPFILSGCNSNGAIETTPTISAVNEETAKAQETQATPTTKPVNGVEIIQPTESNTDDQSPVNIYNINSFWNTTGAFRVVGLVQNNSSRTINNIKIDISVFDSTDQFLYADTANTLLFTLIPGEISPFVLKIDSISKDAKYATGIISSYGNGKIERSSVEILGVTTSVDDSNKVNITGELYNGNLDPIQINGLAGAVFNQDGEIIATNAQTVSSQYLDPGEKGVFRITMTGSDPEILSFTDYHVFADVQVTNPQGYFDLTFSESPTYYMDPSDWFHLVGEITNHSETPFQVGFIAGVYDEAGNVIDVAQTNLPINTLLPGDILPFDFSNWGPLNSKMGWVDSAVRFSIQWDPYWTEVSESTSIELQIENDSYTVDGFFSTFSGFVTNNTNRDLSNIVVLVSLYDQSQIISMNSALLGNLSVGKNKAYEIIVDVPTGFEIQENGILVRAFGFLP